MPESTRGKSWIGTSNIVLPGNKSTFPGEFQAKSRLNYYSSLFNSVELNSTFYKIPMPATFKKWSQDVKNEFSFSVKLWKGITHVKDLKFKKDDIIQFVQNAHCLQNKKGCLLLQFPGKITLEYFNQVENILTILNSSDYIKEWDKAIEFRNKSWYVGETMELLDEYNTSVVMHDYPKGCNSRVNKKAPIIYNRFHGPSGDYKGSYSLDFLLQKAAQINECLKDGKSVYTYFNNTAGDAYRNARTLNELIKI